MDILKLTIQNLTAGYDGREILHGVSATVMPGELVALIGPNGTGKSTLIKAVSGILPITGGSIHIDSRDLLKLNSLERARLVSVIPQARHLPPAFTVREVVRMGRTPYIGWLGKISSHDEDVAEQAMQRTHISELADRQINELSGGEQQRVLVARAIAQQPRLLLLDEPTTHLDIQYQLNLMEIIVELAHHDHLAVLMAVHDLNLAAHFADRIVLLVRGEVAASGTPGEVMKTDLLSKAYQVPLFMHEGQDQATWISPF
jgi:iron complex transport system ATP-binding protein